MGAFAEMLDKAQREDKQARFAARLELMKKHKIEMSDIESGKWEIREEGPFGKTVLKAYKLVESVAVTMESKIRVTTESTTHD